jgi:hypothetical protein
MILSVFTKIMIAQTSSKYLMNFFHFSMEKRKKMYSHVQPFLKYTTLVVQIYSKKINPKIQPKVYLQTPRHMIRCSPDIVTSYWSKKMRINSKIESVLNGSLGCGKTIARTPSSQSFFGLLSLILPNKFTMKGRKENDESAKPSQEFVLKHIAIKLLILTLAKKRRT